MIKPFFNIQISYYNFIQLLKLEKTEIILIKSKFTILTIINKVFL